jgi:allantoicase
MEHGAQVVGCSDMHYGAPANLLLPGLAGAMGEGWETARRRDDGNDWVVLRLAAPGRIRLVDMDTSHFKGNAPAAAALHGCDARAADVEDPRAWFPLLHRTRLQPDTRHRLRIPPAPAPVTHVRLDIYPDGGMARLRLYGEIGSAERDLMAMRWFNALPAAQAIAVAAVECGLPPDAAQALVSARPLADPAALPTALRAD